MKISYHLKLAFVYLVFGTLWILLTDFLVFSRITDSFLHHRIETIKGIFFVFVSTGLIYITSKLLMSRIEKEKERNSNLAFLLDNANDAIMIKGYNGNILYWNKGAENLYGWRKEDVVGKQLSDVIKYSPEEIQDVIKGVENDGEWFGEMVTFTRDGEQRTTYTRWSRIGTFEGDENPVLIISSDISEIKNLEERLQRIQRLENLGMLSSEIAHDLNNVIQPILMSSDILRESVNDSKLRNIADMINQSARRGTELVQQILTFSKGLKSKKSYVNTVEIVEEVASIAQRTFPDTVKVDYEADENINSIYGVRTQIDQVLMNLIVNARDAVRNEGHIYIKAENFKPDDNFMSGHNTSEYDSYIRLSVKDSGSGIAPEIIDRIYEPFFTTKGRESGTGIGLSTCKRVIEEHDGFMEVKSEPGVGTEFIVYLPSSAPAEETTNAGSIQDEYAASGESVLVADDELFVRELLKGVLESANYNVITADNGEHALSLLSENSDLGKNIKAVITDLEMPNLTGHELARKLKDINPGIRVMVISGSSGLDEFDKLREEPNGYIDSFILKPFTNQKLLDSLREILQKRV